MVAKIERDQALYKKGLANAGLSISPTPPVCNYQKATVSSRSGRSNSSGNEQDEDEMPYKYASMEDRSKAMETNQSYED